MKSRVRGSEHSCRQTSIDYCHLPIPVLYVQAQRQVSIHLEEISLLTGSGLQQPCPGEPSSLYKARNRDGNQKVLCELLVLRLFNIGYI